MKRACPPRTLRVLLAATWQRMGLLLLVACAASLTDSTSAAARVMVAPIVPDAVVGQAGYAFISIAASCDRCLGLLSLYRLELASDPGVFALSPTATGRSGSGCARTTFAVSQPTVTGSVTLTPPNGELSIGVAPEGNCVVELTFSVLRMPRVDTDSGQPGTQTLWSALAETTGEAGRRETGLGATETTVTATQPPPATPPPATPPPATPPPPAPPSPLVGVSFNASPKSLRVSKTGSLTYSFLAPPLSSGKISLKSTKKVKIGPRKRFMALATKGFTASSKGTVNIHYTLASVNLKALKRIKQLPFLVTTVIGGKTFTTKLTMKAPAKS